MLQIINDKALSTQATEDKRNEAILANAGSIGVGDRVGGSIKNLLTVVNLAKSKLTKLKKARLLNTKAHSGTDFLIPRAKKAFIYL